ncbi:MAG: RNA polymerase sigma factor [Planctomycetes bacterium]|nr:RNA polymerase sigma factor [Planctomycetota bacterium]
MSDEELLRRARGGDREALNDLLASCRDGVVRFVTAIIGEPSEAEDVFQIVCEAVQTGLSRFEGRSAFSTWVYQIALNQARRVQRNRARHARPSDPETLDAARAKGRGVLSSIYRRELHESIDHAVGGLPSSLKEAFVLRYLEGKDYDEIAEITGVTANTLYVRAHRARSLLKAALGPVVDSFWTE